MSLLQHALRLAEAGFHVFPLIEGGKLPLIDDFPNKATRDPAVIRRWWVDPVTEWEQPWNIGISTSRYGDGQALLVVDIDNKEGRNGDAAILALELEGYEFPTTYTQTTPTGGRHLVYLVDEAVRQGANVLGAGVDTRSRGGFIVGAGSVTERGHYEAGQAPIARAPAWLVERCGRAPASDRAPSAAPVANVDAERARRRAVHYLEHEAPVATAGERNQQGFKTAARLKDFGVDEATCLALMLEHWRCEPMLDRDEVAHVVRSAYRYGDLPPGAAAPESDFAPVAPPVEPPAEDAKHPFEKLNRQFAFVVAGGGHHILWETTDSKGRFKLEHLAESTFHRMHASWLMQTGKKAEPVTEQWMTHPSRRSYDGICFMPGREAPARWYNLWRGFAVEPATEGSDEAQWALAAWREHLRENVCRGDEKLTRWLTGYFAHLVQRPWEKPLVALVLRGGKGVGKNALVELGVQGLLGAHAMLVTDRRYLVGNFNGHLENLLLLTFDEAFWSGDKQAEGVLKGLITGREHNIEHKGKEPYKVDNLCRVVIIGNEDWLVPASHDERRFAVFDVGEGRKQDRAFFQRMREGMEAGGYRLLLRYLLDFDLTGIDVNEAPATAALVDQKHASLDPFHQWWLDCLSEGWIVGSDFGGEWPAEVGKESFRAAYRRYVKERNIRARVPDERTVGKLLKVVAPSVSPGKQRSVGNTYKFQSLDQHRREWSAWVGHEVQWD